MDLETDISKALRAGVAICLAFLLVGTALVFINSGADGYTIDQIVSNASTINSSGFSLVEIVSGLARLDGLSFIFVGLMVLIATPIIRVLMSIFAFAMERNWLYTVITIIVFIDLMVAIFVVPQFIHGMISTTRLP
jgi:uncharacterized membrane protein